MLQRPRNPQHLGRLADPTSEGAAHFREIPKLCSTLCFRAAPRRVRLGILLILGQQVRVAVVKIAVFREISDFGQHHHIPRAKNRPIWAQCRGSHRLGDPTSGGCCLYGINGHTGWCCPSSPFRAHRTEVLPNFRNFVKFSDFWPWHLEVLPESRNSCIPQEGAAEVLPLVYGDGGVGVPK